MRKFLFFTLILINKLNLVLNNGSLFTTFSTIPLITLDWYILLISLQSTYNSKLHSYEFLACFENVNIIHSYNEVSFYMLVKFWISCLYKLHKYAKYKTYSENNITILPFCKTIRGRNFPLIYLHIIFDYILMLRTMNF